MSDTENGNETPRTYSLRSAARYVGISVRTLRNIADKELIPVRPLGNGGPGRPPALLFDEADLKALRQQIDFPTRAFKPLFRQNNKWDPGLGRSFVVARPDGRANKVIKTHFIGAGNLRPKRKGNERHDFWKFTLGRGRRSGTQQIDEFKAKRAKLITDNHNRELEARKTAEAEVKAKADTAKQLEKEREIQKNLEARVRARILSSPSATEADVKRLFDKTRDELIAEDGRKVEQETDAARRTRVRKMKQVF